VIRHTVVYKTKAVIVLLYKSFVQQYCLQAWKPHLKKDVELLEKVQRRALKMIDELKECVMLIYGDSLTFNTRN